MPGDTVKFRYQLDHETGPWTETADKTTTSFSPAAPLTIGHHTLYVQAQDSLAQWSESGNCEILLAQLLTTAADFAGGRSFQTDTAAGDQLQLGGACSAFPYVWATCSGSSRAYKIDAETGTILGTYLTGPGGSGLNPHTVSVDQHGNCWIGNLENGSQGSLVCIGLKENGEYQDRNMDGRITTSTGITDLEAWPYPATIASAQDECILA